MNIAFNNLKQGRFNSQLLCILYDFVALRKTTNQQFYQTNKC